MSETETPPGAPATETPATNGQPSFLWFKKVMAAMPFYVDRKAVAFEPLDRNLGVLKISANDPLAPALLAAANAKRGGIVQIDEAQADELKKKLPFKPLVPKSLRSKLQVLQTDPPRRSSSQPGGAGAAAVNRVSGRASVGPVGGGGTGDGAGTPKPVSAPSPAAVGEGEFKPATARKPKMPVTKKATGRSLSGGVPEPEPTG